MNLSLQVSYSQNENAELRTFVSKLNELKLGEIKHFNQELDSHKVNSLTKQLLESNFDIQKINTYNKGRLEKFFKINYGIANEYSAMAASDSSNFYKYCNIVQILAEKIDEPEFLGQAYLIAGKYSRDKGNIGRNLEATHKLTLAVDNFDMAGNDIYKALSKFELAKGYQKLLKFEDAKFCYTEAIDLFKLGGAEILEARCKLNLSAIFTPNENYEQAFQLLREAELTCSDSLNKLSMDSVSLQGTDLEIVIASILNQQSALYLHMQQKFNQTDFPPEVVAKLKRTLSKAGLIFLNKKQYHNAATCALNISILLRGTSDAELLSKKAIEIANQLNNIGTQLNYYQNMVINDLHLKNVDLANEHFKYIIELNKKIQMTTKDSSQIFQLMGWLAYESGRMDSAKHYYVKAHGLNKRNKLTNLIRKNLSELCKVYSSSENISYHKYNNELLALDTIGFYNKINILANIDSIVTSTYNEKRKLKLRLLEFETQNNRLMEWIGYIFYSALFLILFWIIVLKFYSFKIKSWLVGTKLFKRYKKKEAGKIASWILTFPLSLFSIALIATAEYTFHHKVIDLSRNVWVNVVFILIGALLFHALGIFIQSLASKEKH